MTSGALGKGRRAGQAVGGVGTGCNLSAGGDDAESGSTSSSVTAGGQTEAAGTQSGAARWDV